jgi:class 3 adenylate cyclase
MPDNTPPAQTSAVRDERKLAATMFTDIVGFSRQMGADEARMLRLLEVHNELISQSVTIHHGHVIKTIGDAFKEKTDLIDLVMLATDYWLSCDALRLSLGSVPWSLRSGTQDKDGAYSRPRKISSRSCPRCAAPQRRRVY